MEKKLLTSAVKVRHQPVKSTIGEESRKQESCDTEESKTIARLESKNNPGKDHQADETEEIKVVMMCWKHSEGSPGKEPYEETDDQDERAYEEMQK